MAAKQKEFICKCFYSRNIFLQKYKLHVTYYSADQFHEDYRQDLRMRGCATTVQYEAVLDEVEGEVLRRKNLHQHALQRFLTISEHYRPLHPHLWDFKVTYLNERLKTIVDVADKTSKKDDLEKAIINNGGNILGNGLYRLPIFSNELCELLVEELLHFEDSPLPKGRPNTMSNFGVSIDELGMSEGLLIPLIVEYIQPLSRLLFDQCYERLDSFKAFSVLYGSGKDRELSMHFDNAEVTLNVCLSSQFEGGELEFGGLWNDAATQQETETVMHKMGTGILHLGQHTHRALPIISGTRCNLILWMRSSAVRNQFCIMCRSKPDLVEVPYAGDGFTQESVHYN